MNFRYVTVLVAVPAVAFVLGAGPGSELQPAIKDPQELGRACTAQFYEGSHDKLWKRFGEAMKSGLGSQDNLKAFREKVAQQLGDETAVVSEKVTKTGDLQVYLRHARFKKLPDLIEVSFAFDGEGMIQGFYIRPQQKEADTPHLDYKTKTDLRLPFEGPWYVFWGGRTIAENYHAVARDQRFAYDVIVMKDGSSHTGDGKTNDQYHCFGRPILAPGAGVVAAVVDGIADNVPGVMNSKQPVGNHVVIDHGNGEFSFLAHIKQGTVRVKEGQSVKFGETLGLCGNSGNSSEPHLHYHLQTTAVYSKGEGLPSQFREYLADGKLVERGEPTKGQTVERRSAGTP